MSRWMGSALPLFEENPGRAARLAGRRIAAGTVRDLQDKEATGRRSRWPSRIARYVKEGSQIWSNPRTNFELLTLADVLWPSLLYLRLHPSPSFEVECQDLLSDLPGFYNPATRSISPMISSARPTRSRLLVPVRKRAHRSIR